jgi:cell division protein FtsB
MLGKLKLYKSKITSRLEGFRDTRVLGLLLFLVILLMVTWSSVNVIGTNYALQQQINHLEQENKISKLTNDNIQLQNSYFKTPQFLDIAARQHFGLASEGETVLVVPDNVAMRFTIDSASTNTQKGINTPDKAQPVYQQNFQAWMDFFLHRQ